MFGDTTVNLMISCFSRDFSVFLLRSIIFRYYLMPLHFANVRFMKEKWIILSFGPYDFEAAFATSL